MRQIFLNFVDNLTEMTIELPLCVYDYVSYIIDCTSIQNMMFNIFVCLYVNSLALTALHLIKKDV